MYPIINKQQKVIAYFYHHMIIDNSLQQVIGIVLGDIVYGYHNKPVGKLLHGSFRNAEGKLLGMISEEHLHLQPTSDEMKHYIVQGWQIVMQVKDHTAIWVKEIAHWHPQTITEVLMNHLPIGLALAVD
jgi:hypothetical protein